MMTLTSGMSPDLMSGDQHTIGKQLPEGQRKRGYGEDQYEDVQVSSRYRRACHEHCANQSDKACNGEHRKREGKSRAKPGYRLRSRSRRSMPRQGPKHERDYPDDCASILRHCE
jgi:hypothetical protein